MVKLPYRKVGDEHVKHRIKQTREKGCNIQIFK